MYAFFRKIEQPVAGEICSKMGISGAIYISDDWPDTYSPGTLSELTRQLSVHFYHLTTVLLTPRSTIRHTHTHAPTQVNQDHNPYGDVLGSPKL